MGGRNKMKKSLGIHHITAIVGNPQENVDFYASVLGLRLVKKRLILTIHKPIIYILETTLHVQDQF